MKLVSMRGVRASTFAAVLMMIVANTALAHFGDPAFLGLPYTEGIETLAAEEGGDAHTARVALVIGRAATLVSTGGETLLPPGTTMDSLTFDGRYLAHVRLTVPDDSDLGFARPARIATLDHLLMRMLEPGTAAIGVAVHVRIGKSPYAPIDTLLPPFEFTPESEVSDDTGKIAAEAAMERAAGLARWSGVLSDAGITGVPAAAGPVAHADGQPSGALSGVVVFVSAGHGWTASDSSWYLQRPLLLEMVEDYGNLEQMYHLVHYLYNAGAVVVPFRPVGYQSVEIVIDNDDPGASFTGTWSDSVTTSGYYENGVTVSGVPYRYAAAGPTEAATARYTPAIPQDDFYPVYAWAKDDTDRVRQTYRIRHTGGTSEVTVDHARVGRGWVWLGNYHLAAGTGGWVEVTNASPDVGIVVADAVRFGNGIGDIVRPGPGTVSGFPREEECSRYWAESEAGNNAVGLSNVWECSGCNDYDDNIGTAARWAAEMNRQNVNADRWRRVYIEYHSNAAGCGQATCGAKGSLCLVSSTAPTTHQTSYATILGDKLEDDMLLLDGGFEHLWGLRSNPISGGYGAISTYNNNNEFDATIAEVAFHDNPDDAENLRSAKVRDALARSTLQGMVMFLSGLPDSGVPLVFLPDPPGNVRVTHDGAGNVAVSWSAPPTGGALGGPATGYKVYRSTNGYGFGGAVNVGNVLTTTLTDLPSLETTYLRVAAYNAGGESLPSETLAVRPAASGTSSVLIVNGYDRVSRHQNFVQIIPQGPMERPIPRYVNAFDYMLQHAEALAASDQVFDASSNDAVISGAVDLNDYEVLVWILGREAEDDHTFDEAEQTLVSNYLTQGGNLFVTGTDIGYELVALGAGQSLYEDPFGASYVGDDGGTFAAIGSGGILDGVGAVDFDPANGAPYPALRPDRVMPQAGATSILTYVGGTGDGAGIQYDAGSHRVVLFGFPFETITSEAVRTDVMQRVMAYLLAGGGGPCGKTRITNFEGYLNGAQVMFREPGYSGTTAGHLAAGPDVAEVTDEVLAFDWLKAYKVQWEWLDTDPSRWLRLTTSDAAGVPNPTINVRRVVRLRLRLDSGSFRLSLGVRETGVDVPIGEDGGTSGTVEWIGASSVVSGAPQGVLVTAQPGVWQTITFVPRPDEVTAFTGDGVLDAPFDKAVFEHLAFAVTDTAGPITVYLDGIEQPCPPPPDFDGDGDVDLVDFGHLQACLSGPSVPQNDPGCQDAKLDTDNDVDQDDYGIMQGCMTGEHLPADPECGG